MPMKSCQGGQFKIGRYVQALQHGIVSQSWSHDSPEAPPGRKFMSSGASRASSGTAVTLSVVAMALDH